MNMAVHRSLVTPSDADVLDFNVDVIPVFLPLLGPARYKGAHGGRGSGKSHYFAEQLIARASYYKLKAVCLREFQTSIKHSVKALLENKIQQLGMERLFEVQNTQIKGRRSGSLIIFQGMQSHNSDSIKSLEDFDIAWFEEAQRASDASLKILRPTLRKPRSELWFSWNRTDPDDAVEQLFYPTGKRTKPPPRTRVVEANWGDNPLFPDVLREEMEYDRRRDMDRYLHVWEGHYQKHSEARVFKNWREEEFDITQLIEAGVELSGPHLGGDWGFATDPTCLVRVYVCDANKRIYIDYEAWDLHCPIHDIGNLFNKVPKASSSYIVADSARPETIDAVRRQGFDIHPARKGAGSVEDGVEFLKSHDIIVHPRCKHTIDELKHYSWKVDKLTGKVLNQLEDKKNHIIDSMRYALEDYRRGHDFY